MTISFVVGGKLPKGRELSRPASPTQYRAKPNPTAGRVGSGEGLGGVPFLPEDEV